MIIVVDILLEIITFISHLKGGLLFRIPPKIRGKTHIQLKSQNSSPLNNKKTSGPSGDPKNYMGDVFPWIFFLEKSDRSWIQKLGQKLTKKGWYPP